jgi:Protein of unknown function (DUF3276).
MEDEFGNKELSQNYENNNFPFKVIRAGKRTYFFDVKTTQYNDFYLTITESKKRYGRDGKYVYEKHKIFLYDEDFESFAEGMTEMMDFIRSQQGRKQLVYNEQHAEDTLFLDSPEDLSESTLEPAVSFDELEVKF